MCMHMHTNTITNMYSTFQLLTISWANAYSMWITDDISL